MHHASSLPFSPASSQQCIPFSCFDLSFIFLSQQNTFVSQIGLTVGGSACVEGASGFKNIFG
jgi:hypothetical protein